MVETFAHAMPFGAQLLPDGRTRFHLWAPSQETLALVLEGERRSLPMTRLEDGFFAVATEAPAGRRYRFQLHDGTRVPDPASRHQPEDVHGPSEVIDPRDFAWRRAGWRGRPWHETVLYELHVGAFSEQGTFDGLRRKLDHLARLGITALELMPLAEFSGSRNWGYDGVMSFAPDSVYGRPEELKRLIDEAHARELMVFLDIVYNHFGPEGNYLHLYAESFFDEEEHTPWGGAINFKCRPVRDFAIHNVLYWLEEYRIDGLRFDAADWILDDSEPHFLYEIAARVRETIADRHVHLVLENDNNDPDLLARGADGRSIYYDAQWNDDIHHVYHHLLTDEAAGYYLDYAAHATERLARALSSGFVYQGDVSQYRDGARRGQPSGHLPPTAFVAFLQNHDQIGNRAFGERLADLAEFEAVKAMQAVLLLAPNIPLLFMGEEWGATQPFCFFTDFHDELADAVREGRRREFRKFPEFASEEARAQIPDPNALSTFAASRLDWSVPEQPEHAACLESVRNLLRIRQERVVPRLAGMQDGGSETALIGDKGLQVTWTLGDGARLALAANLGSEPQEGFVPPRGELIFESREGVLEELGQGRLPGWSLGWFLAPAS
ncbi:MAG TPA: malto-oligosyltrehalose trehalohydrolase [Geminicoccaceae bacterium]|nr:malto-oligosyltrehalose trehalohydrolase [Geminicoccaceae bacterium]